MCVRVRVCACMCVCVCVCVCEGINFRAEIIVPTGIPNRCSELMQRVYPYRDNSFTEAVHESFLPSHLSVCLPTHLSLLPPRSQRCCVFLHHHPGLEGGRKGEGRMLTGVRDSSTPNEPYRTTELKREQGS